MIDFLFFDNFVHHTLKMHSSKKCKLMCHFETKTDFSVFNTAPIPLDIFICNVYHWKEECLSFPMICMTLRSRSLLRSLLAKTCIFHFNEKMAGKSEKMQEIMSLQK